MSTSQHGNSLISILIATALISLCIQSLSTYILSQHRILREHADYQVARLLLEEAQYHSPIIQEILADHPTHRLQYMNTHWLVVWPGGKLTL